ncbi:MAG: hypothetical protein WDZ79_02550, partial [Candidatus Paceibacterota bacterium]
MSDQENDQGIRTERDDLGKVHYEQSTDGGPGAVGEPVLAEADRKHGGLSAGRLFGSFIYVYFTFFVIFHVAVALVFLMTTMNPMTGLVLWIIIMLLGG